MRSLHKVRLRLRSLFRRDRLEHELGAEIRFHLDQQIEENLASGLAPDEARLAALRMIGGIPQIQEDCRDMRRLNLIENFLQDFRYAFTCIGKSPGFLGQNARPEHVNKSAEGACGEKVIDFRRTKPWQEVSRSRIRRLTATFFKTIRSETAADLFTCSRPNSPHDPAATNH